jgi:hypothetical protein
VRIPVALLHEADRRVVKYDLSQKTRDEQYETPPAVRRAVQVERRREPRYPANDIVEVQVVGGSTERFPGTILDLSRSGLRLEVGKPLSRGTHLEIVLRHRAIIFGESCYARPKNGLYQVGVSIENVYFAKTDVSEHIDVMLLRHYSRGGSLATLQVLEINNHLHDCETCRGVVAAYKMIRFKEGGAPAWAQEHEKI